MRLQRSRFKTFLVQTDSETYKIKLLLSYDGSVYNGWQKQPNNPQTVQQKLEGALTKLFEENVRIVGSGRTDAGVHALNQVAHFEVQRDPRKYTLVAALRGMLGPSIIVKKAWLAPHEFHAQRSAVSKTYKYIMLHQSTPTALFYRHSHWLKKKPGESSLKNQLNSYAKVFIGTHDFTSFQNTGTEIKSPVRTIFESQWLENRPGRLEYWVKGSGFLKQMVRNLVGIQLYGLKEGATPADIQKILLAKSRSHLGGVAPAEGLYLQAVEYPAELDNRCVEL